MNSIHPLQYKVNDDDRRQINIILRYFINQMMWIPQWIIPNDDESFICWEDRVYIVRDTITYTYSYHDLFSAESFLFDIDIEWKDTAYVFESWVFKDRMWWHLPHLFLMSVLDASKKVNHFVSNIILPSVSHD